MKTEKNLKRNNWTNEEVIKILEGSKICLVDGSLPKTGFASTYNEGIQHLIHTFEDFMRPAEEMGAMAYEPEEDMIYHIGKVPPR